MAAPGASTAGTTAAAWHALSVPAALAACNSGITGLRKPEALNRLRLHGPNRLTPAKTRTLLAMIWDQLANIIMVILIAAAVLAAVFEHWVELGFIAGVVIANVAIGVVQEGKAEAATKAIANLVTTTATVLRNERKVDIDAAELVPGDVIFLSPGDRVPADVRVLQTAQMRVVESALTGESSAVEKTTEPVAPDAQLGDRKCMAFLGTLVISGEGTGLVVATGDRAEIGRINELVSGVETLRTPLQQQIAHFGFVLSIGCIGVVILTFLVAYFARDEELEDALELAVSVAVALIPEGLPTVVTITLALGVQTMARSKAIIRQLPAVETLGAVTCICSDKTGTLTKNEMTAVAVYFAGARQRLAVTGTGYHPVGTVQLEAGGNALDTAAAQQLRELLLPAALPNQASLMPVVSAEAQQLLLSQPLTLPFLDGTQDRAALAASLQEPFSTSVNTAPPTAESVEWCITGSPTEAALLALAMKAGLNYRTLRELAYALPRIDTIPFSSDYKFMATVHNIPAAAGAPPRRVLLAKGAVDVLLPRCVSQASGLDPWMSEPLDIGAWREANAALAAQGMRVLALCQADLPAKDSPVTLATVLEGEPRLQINALVAIVDPPREEAITAIRSCHQAGIDVKMITGDHAVTARTIGGWIGLDPTVVITGPELEKMSDDALAAQVNACQIFARTSPEHKLRIVRALQSHRHVVAMTGDGVNDAPALRQANIGVAMGVTGTEVAKEAARMILQDDNFATIEVAVRLGRSTYDNLRKLMMFILPTTIAQGFSVALSVFIGIRTPLTQVQILYVNMVTAATLGLVLAAEAPESDVMMRSPRPTHKQLVGKHIIWRCVFVGGALIAAMLGQQAWTEALDRSDEEGHTMAMNTLVISQCLYCLSCRSLKQTALSWTAVSSNRWLAAMVVLNLSLQAIITYTPGVQGVWGTTGIGILEWLRILMFAVAIFLLVEAEKAYGHVVTEAVALPLLNRIGLRPTVVNRRGDGKTALAEAEAAANGNGAASNDHGAAGNGNGKHTEAMEAHSSVAANRTAVAAALAASNPPVVVSIV